MNTYLMLILCRTLFYVIFEYLTNGFPHLKMKKQRHTEGKQFVPDDTIRGGGVGTLFSAGDPEGCDLLPHVMVATNVKPFAFQEDMHTLATFKSMWINVQAEHSRMDKYGQLAHAAVPSHKLSPEVLTRAREDFLKP